MMKRAYALAVGLTVAALTRSAAQTPASAAGKPVNDAYRYRILGVYDEQTGDPVEGVEVADALNGNKSLTTKTGTVSLFFLPDGGALVRLRKIGYATQTIPIAISPADTTPVTVVLSRAQQLPAVVVNDTAKKFITPMMRQFEARKAQGFGHFVDDSVFRNNDSHMLADLLPARLPGLQIVAGPGGAKFFASGRKQCAGFVLLSKCDPTKLPSCYVAVYVDGVRTYDPSLGAAIRPNFAREAASEYSAAEFYQGAAIPAEFNSTANSDCGVLLLWTRIR